MTNAFFRGVVILLLAAAMDYGQGVTRPSFEVAAINPSEPLSTESNRLAEIDLFSRMVNGGVKADPAQVRFTFKTLAELIPLAYRVKSFQVSAPEWMSGTRWDIAAKMPAGASTDLVPDMLQSLLEDRFKLTYHRASKDFDVYVLSAGEGGLKIPPKPADYRFSRTNATVPETMESLAGALSRAMGRPVLDQTGLHSEYMVPRDFQSLVDKGAIGRMLPDSATSDSAMEIPSAGAIRRSIQALGLSLKPSKQPMPLLVIDHAEKTPTAN